MLPHRRPYLVDRDHASKTATNGLLRLGIVAKVQLSRKSIPQESAAVSIGYDKPLYVLPFDHRATFSRNMFGWQGPLDREQTEQIAAVKQVIYDGFKAAVAGGVPRERAGILVDEQFGAAILRDALKQGFITSCPAEKSGQNEFDFEYGPDFARHLEEFNPTFC
jgi:5-dehydro-2-deoxygluconokinase